MVGYSIVRERGGNWIGREDPQSHSAATGAADSHTPRGLLEVAVRRKDSARAAQQTQFNLQPRHWSQGQLANLGKEK